MFLKALAGACASALVLGALAPPAHALNPQPLPPKQASVLAYNPAASRMLNPQPLPPKQLRVIRYRAR